MGYRQRLGETRLSAVGALNRNVAQYNIRYHQSIQDTEECKALNPITRFLALAFLSPKRDDKEKRELGVVT